MLSLAWVCYRPREGKDNSAKWKARCSTCATPKGIVVVVPTTRSILQVLQVWLFWCQSL